MSEDTTIRMPVTVTRNNGSDKSRRYTATYGPWQHPIEAEGSTPTEAKANLTALLAAALHAVRADEPRFARDDNGAVHVAVPDYDGGSRWYRVTDEKATLTTFSRHATSEAFTTCVGMTVIPGR